VAQAPVREEKTGRVSGAGDAKTGGRGCAADCLRYLLATGTREVKEVKLRGL
jgi:hypothetical protein